jgi:hypothetical protein
LLALWVVLIYFSSCKSTERVVVKTEYVNQLKHDSIYVQKHDSICVYSKGDTIWIEKFHTLFKDRLKIQKDTIVKTDSVFIKAPPVEVKVPVVVNKWGFLDWIGLVVLIAGTAFLFYEIITKTTVINWIRKISK